MSVKIKFGGKWDRYNIFKELYQANKFTISKEYRNILEFRRVSTCRGCKHLNIRSDLN